MQHNATAESHTRFTYRSQHSKRGRATLRWPEEMYSTFDLPSAHRTGRPIPAIHRWWTVNSGHWKNLHNLQLRHQGDKQKSQHSIYTHLKWSKCRLSGTKMHSDRITATTCPAIWLNSSTLASAILSSFWGSFSVDLLLKSEKMQDAKVELFKYVVSNERDESKWIPCLNNIKQLFCNELRSNTNCKT